MTQRIILIAVLLVAAFLRIFFALTCGAIPDFSDMALYNEAAISSGIPSFPPPGYPLFLRAIYSIFGSCNYTAVFVIQGILSILTVWLVYFVTRKVSNERAGLIAAGIAAIYPNLIAYNLTTLTETLTVFLAMIALAIAVSSFRDVYKSILIGVVLFLGYFVKPSMLFFIPGLLICVKKRLVLLITLAATLGPLFIYGAVTGTGEGRGGALLYKAYNPKAAVTPNFRMEDTELGREGVSSDEYFGETVKFILSNKWKTLDIIYRKSSLLLSRGWDRFVLKDIVGKKKLLQEIMLYAYLPIMVLGFIGLVRHYNKKNRIIALMMISYLVIHILITIFKLRYRLLIEPMLIIYAGILLGSMKESTMRERIDETRIKDYLRKIFSKAKSSSKAFTRDSREALLNTFRGNWDFLLIIIFLALALRMYFAFTAELTLVSHESLKMNNLAISSPITAADAPLYPLLLRFLYKLFGSGNLRAIYVFQGLINTVTVILIYIIGSKLCTRRLGLIAAALAAIYPQFLAHTITVNATSLGILIVVLLMLITLSHETNRFKAISSGMLIGLAILFKPLYVFLLPGTFIVIKKRSILLLTAFILIAPLGIRNSAMESEFVPVYQQHAWGIDFMKYKKRLGENKTLIELYSNAANILRKDYQDKLKSDLRSEVRNVNYIYTYSYILVMLLGLMGLFKYSRKEHLVAILPVLCYIVLLVFCSKLYNKPQARFLWEPVLVTYGAMLLNRKCAAT